MPRQRRDEPPATNSLIASAARLSRENLVRPRTAVTDWQSQAWYFLDTIGELRFAANWLGNALSRVRLTVMQETDDGEEELEDGPAVDALAALFGGESGQSQMMSAFGIHLTVPGEAYLIGLPAEEGSDEEDQWIVASTEEMKVSKAGVWSLDRGDGRKIPLSDEEDLIIRIWRSHPRKWVEADSPVRACLPILRELEQLTKHVAATTDSRLAGAGLLMVPSEMTFASPPGDPATAADPTVDPFIAALTEAMITPINDRASASAVVPIVVKAPGALLANAQLIRFDTPFDQHAQELRQEAIRRMALGMDMPPEVLLGQADSNHWSAWQIEESALKVHVEPVCELITDALTRKFLGPVLEGTGEELPEGVYIGFDTSDLRMRPDHSSEAIQLYDRLELSGDALRRETGFDEGDTPDDDEVTRILTLMTALKGQVTPEQSANVLDSLGVETIRQLPPPPPGRPGIAPRPPAAPPPAPVPAPTQPQPPAVESRRTLPSPEGPQVAAVLAAGEVLVLRALERANNRLNRRGKTRRPVPPDRVDAALADAWTAVPRVAALLTVDAEWMEQALDTYTRALLAEGAEHTPAVLTRLLQVPGAPPLLAANRGG